MKVLPFLDHLFIDWAEARLHLFFVRINLLLLSVDLVIKYSLNTNYNFHSQIINFNLSLSLFIQFANITQYWQAKLLKYCSLLYFYFLYLKKIVKLKIWNWQIRKIWHNLKLKIICSNLTTTKQLRYFWAHLI